MKIRIQTPLPMVSDTSQHSTPGSDGEKQPHFPSSPHQGTNHSRSLEQARRTQGINKPCPCEATVSGQL